MRIKSTKDFLLGTQKDLDVKGANTLIEAEKANNAIEMLGNTDIDFQYGPGDFRSEAAIELLKECDIVVTNPPFSLFREFMSLLMKYEKQFLLIGNKNAITYKEFFPLLKDNKAWLGYNTLTEFSQPNGELTNNMTGLCKWFTNIDHLKRHQMLPLDLGFTYSNHEDMYPKYDNYDAINVDKVNQIPCDYMGVMGVPITFLGSYCSEQFEIIKFRKGNDEKDLSVNGNCPYFRILIKRK